jgi:hypothetical protein
VPQLKGDLLPPSWLLPKHVLEPLANGRAMPFFPSQVTSARGRALGGRVFQHRPFSSPGSDRADKPLFDWVRTEGIEPSCPFGRQNLNLNGRAGSMRISRCFCNGWTAKARQSTPHWGTVGDSSAIQPRSTNTVIHPFAVDDATALASDLSAKTTGRDVAGRSPFVGVIPSPTRADPSPVR